MSAYEIAIDSLPESLSLDEAVEAVYRADLDWVEDKLRRRLSVLVDCDKQLSSFVYRALRRRLKREPAMPLRLITGHAAPSADDAAPSGGMLRRLLGELRDAVFSGGRGAVAALLHLDILTTTTRSGLNPETREAAALLYEDPEQVFLGFRDPSFELPEVIEQAFAVRRELVGVPRDALPRLILRGEARKLGAATFRPYRLYKYLSGLNPVRCRQILSHLAGRLDFDPTRPEAAEGLFRELRDMTLVSDLEVPNVDLEKDIGGYGAVKEQIRKEILELLLLREQAADPDAARELEALVPRGVIFHGPPGTGKTYFAKALAAALDATITIVSGPELKSRWVGESERKLRRIFARARRSAPAIIVFDELDAFASARGTYTGSGVEHSMVNQLLTEMDGFRKEELVFVVGTTNFLESIDGALLRPGRFELAIRIGYPDAEDRRAIFEVYRDRLSLNIDEPGLDLLVDKTAGVVDAERGGRFTGDHLYAVARALKREEARRGQGPMVVGRAEIEDAVAARTRKPARLKAAEERAIAVHEVGHAVCAYVLPRCPNVERVTIATGDDEVLGYVMQAVKEHRYVTTRGELLDDICVLLGGRGAEESFFDGEVTVGAANDLKRATELCRLMAEELGMVEELGPRSFTDRDSRPLSEAWSRRIDAAIDAILTEQRARAAAVIAEHRAVCEELVGRLLREKSLELEAIREAFGGRAFKET